MKYSKLRSESILSLKNILSIILESEEPSGRGLWSSRRRN